MPLGSVRLFFFSLADYVAEIKCRYDVGGVFFVPLVFGCWFLGEAMAVSKAAAVLRQGWLVGHVIHSSLSCVCALYSRSSVLRRYRAYFVRGGCSLRGWLKTRP